MSMIEEHTFMLYISEIKMKSNFGKRLQLRHHTINYITVSVYNANDYPRN